MNRDESKLLVEKTFEYPFSKERFELFVRNLFPDMEQPSSAIVVGAQLPKGFEDHVVSITRLGKYRDPAGDVLDAVAVKLKNPSSLERARSRQRNLMAHYLSTRGKDAALVAFFSDESPDWRFSFVRLAYETEVSQGKVRAKRQFTPARRYSFLVGQSEPSHTAQQQLAPLLEQQDRLTVSDVEAAFNIETVTNEFFERYKNLFLKIKDELDVLVKKNNKVKQEFDRCQIDTVSFSKKLLGQIVFLYFIQKKGWLGVQKNAKWGEGNKDFLSNLFEDSQKMNYFKDVLEPFFYKALALERSGDYYPALECKVPFLNGGLFEPLNNYDWKKTPIEIGNKIFGEIFEVFNLYNFTVREDEPLEKEVAVDPEMLGKVFENLLEVTDRRSKGAYYTPREIVHYMCQESLIHYLDNAINAHGELVPKHDLETLIWQGDVSLENDLAKEGGRKSGEYGLPESVRSAAAQLDTALANTKICDPAIGSGAFPVGMMTEIVRARTALTATPSLKNKNVRSAYDFKWHCIENSLYGVDIEPSAVEIAKLRLWLSLVVDEENYDHIRPLPNLDYRIVCGNSLLSVQKNLFNYALFSELEQKKIQYFGSTSQGNKNKLRKEINSLIGQLTDGNRVFDFEIYFSEVFSGKNGFDVIIANPPYIKEYVQKSAFDGLRDSPYYQGKMDIWYFFACKSIDLVRPDSGIVTFIAQNNWVTSHGASKMRNKLLDDAQILSLLDFGDYKVFQAGIQTMIMLFQRNRNQPEYRFDYRRLSVNHIESEDLVLFMTSESNEMGISLNPSINRAGLKNDTFTFSEPELESILKKVGERSNFKLDGETEVAQGIVTPQDSVNKASKAILGDGKIGDGIFVIAENEIKKAMFSPKDLSLLKPFYTTEELGRWIGRSKNSKWIIYTDSSFRGKSKIKEFPGIKAHLDRYKKVITSDNKPYGLHRARDERFFTGEKILSVRKCSYPTFTFVDFDSYVTATFYVIKTERLSQKYLVGLLNSTLIAFWLRRKGKMQGENYQIDKEPLLALPLIKPESKGRQIEEVVDQILDSLKKDPSTNVKPLEMKIDQIVYDMYGLTENEISLVRNSFPVGNP